MTIIVSIHRGYEIMEPINTMKKDEPDKYKELRYMFPDLKLNAVDDKNNDTYGSDINLTTDEMEILMNTFGLPNININKIKNYKCASCGA